MKSQLKQFMSIFMVLAILFATKLVLAPSGGNSAGGIPLRSQTSAQKWASEQEEKKKAAEGGSVDEGAPTTDDKSADAGEKQLTVEKDGSYTSKEEVALYLHIYKHLPQNFINKYEASTLGWDSKTGNLQEVAPGKSIGGSNYGNYEKSVPEKDGRVWRECDINYEGGYRGAERIIYSNDGLIYYTGDHYKTFTQLY
ncbi:MAG: ribonuclease domain-containing protein [Hydrogenoanaerobacterium sp.]